MPVNFEKGIRVSLNLGGMKLLGKQSNEHTTERLNILEYKL
jgi:hypothetical protein